ncbi:hypothetical protein VW23_007680 [Devosia insulae DS-56]|uniref:CSD domain-containing protein n=1 Tax=Devosia insulae DS-56 TaxID=1116389 RepID=A0A1E5XXB1_9HYPH|nr:DUF1294 domain-containing protein [Devosia insulae]OEO33258.1 hypothetical protein VW23_007680 [Devosia insulae DS-56]
MARQSGELVQWNDERGFGFIAADDGERRFVHISDIGRIATRPRVGDRVSFTLGRGSDGRLAAKDVKIAGANPLNVEARRRGAPTPTAPSIGGRGVGAGSIVALALADYLLGRVPVWLPIAYLVLGAVSIAVYWFDKRAAETDRWRVTEKSLHLIDAIGGIAGGLVAQQLLRHKTSKQSFIVVTMLIAVVHVAVLASLGLGWWTFAEVLA